VVRALLLGLVTQRKFAGTAVATLLAGPGEVSVTVILHEFSSGPPTKARSKNKGLGISERVDFVT
jgi:hypothetical protein